MSGLFYNLGKAVGPGVRKAKWIWQSIAGSKADEIKVEREVGRDLAQQLTRQLGLDTEAQSTQVLNETGNKLVACVADKSRKFSFGVVKSGQPNAFALPGGFVFISRSLLDLCQWNQNEIAFILGHEMSHVIRGHAMARIISNSAINTASRVVPVTGLLRVLGIKFLESAYSQQLEAEADSLGVRLVKAAGYDSGACVKLLSRLAKLSHSVDGLDLGIYFSSHPDFDTRIRDINNLLHKQSR